MQNDRVCDQVDVFRPLVKSRKIPTMIGDQKRVQSTSSTRHAAIDPRYRHAVRLNNRSCDDTAFKTLHLFLKIKVLRQPFEATVQTCRSWVDLVLQLSIPKPDFDAELQRFNILGGDFAELS
jgi:hypothetical protein